tara:strand:- start:66 stop:230 length:165 start_codon:yes stop_codon:yes gene_type:complete
LDKTFPKEAEINVRIFAFILARCSTMVLHPAPDLKPLLYPELVAVKNVNHRRAG